MKVDNLLPGVVEPPLGIDDPPPGVVSADMVQVYSGGCGVGVGQAEARVVKEWKIPWDKFEVLDQARKSSIILPQEKSFCQQTAAF